MPSEPLDAVEARIFGTLVEKELTTPEGYPLSLNALQNGCNQKSNREPVSNLDEQSIREALLRLRLHRLVREVTQAGARVVKYAHDGAATLALQPPALAIVAELLLRGPQMPGELRTRASRMAPMDTQADLDALLATLGQRGFVERLAPEPGSRAPRWRQTLAPGLHGAGPAAGAGTPAAAGPATGAGPAVRGIGQTPAAPTPVAQTSGAAPLPAAAASLAPRGGDAPQIAEILRRVADLERRVAGLESAARDGT